MPQSLSFHRIAASIIAGAVLSCGALAPARTLAREAAGDITATVVAASGARAQAWNPDAIAWQRTNPDGTRFALLEGVRDQAGVVFSYAFFIPAGVWDGPHWHTADARVFVARGALHLGYGDHLDPTSAATYPAGGYLIVPAGARHFDGAVEDTVIIGTAVGPWATQYVSSASTPSANAPAPGQSRSNPPPQR